MVAKLVESSSKRRVTARPTVCRLWVAALAIFGLACGASPAPSAPSRPRLSVAPAEASDAELRGAVVAAYAAGGPVACCPELPCGSSICEANRQDERRAAEQRDAEFVRRFGQGAFDRVRGRHADWVRRSCMEVTCPVDVPPPQ